MMNERIAGKPFGERVVPRTERILFLVVTVIGAVYVALRAARVPIIHDEAATFFHYILTGNFWPGTALWDANNHVLNSLLTWWSYSAFGEGLFALRLPNVLAFMIWCYATWRCASFCRDRTVRWALILALLFCPFMLEFFSLCRGYGMGMAFFLLACVSDFSLQRSGERRSLIMLLWAAACSVWADMALIPALGLLFMICTFGMWHANNWQVLRHWSSKVTIVCTGILGLLALDHTRKMSKSGLLYHGSLDGFLPVTLKPLFKLVLGYDDVILIVTVLMFVAILSGVALRKKVLRDKLFVTSSPLFISTATLLSLFLITMMAALVLHINFPEDRAALQFVVLFILIVAYAIDALATERPPLKWFALVLLVLPIRSIALLNVDHTLLWSEQSIPDGLFDAAQASQAKAERQLTIGVYHQHTIVWAYAQRQRKATLPDALTDKFPNTWMDVIFADSRYVGQIDQQYHLVSSIERDTLSYFERNTPLHYTSYFIQPIAPLTTSNEFTELPQPNAGIGHFGPEQIRLKAELRLTANAPCYWVVSAQGEHGDQEYRSRSVHYINAMNDLRKLDVVQVMFNELKNVTERKCYLWNPKKMPIEVLSGSVEFLNITEH